MFNHYLWIGSTIVKLTSIQRLASMETIGVMSFLSLALEILPQLLPLPILRKENPFLANNLQETIVIECMLGMSLGMMCTRPMFDAFPQYFSSKQNGTLKQRKGTCWFVDGSKTEQGAETSSRRPRIKQYYNFGQHTSISQTEI